MIALVDYGAGNLASVRKALAAIGAETFVPASPGELSAASGVIVPGVGHFDATRALDAAWHEAIIAHIGDGRPLLGICLGMQWLYEGSDEAPDVPGLGLFSGQCYRLGAVRLPAFAEGYGGSTEASRGGGKADTTSAVKVPHVGWNTLTIDRQASTVADIESGAQVYFTHSYAAPVTGDTIATTDHGGPFASIVQRAQIAGVQFHPEKSGDVGLQVLRNFLELA